MKPSKSAIPTVSLFFSPIRSYQEEYVATKLSSYQAFKEELKNTVDYCAEKTSQKEEVSGNSLLSLS